MIPICNWLFSTNFFLVLVIDRLSVSEYSDCFLDIISTLNHNLFSMIESQNFHSQTLCLCIFCFRIFVVLHDHISRNILIIFLINYKSSLTRFFSGSCTSTKCLHDIKIILWIECNHHMHFSFKFEIYSSYSIKCSMNNMRNLNNSQLSQLLICNCK